MPEQIYRYVSNEWRRILVSAVRCIRSVCEYERQL